MATRIRPPKFIPAERMPKEDEGLETRALRRWLDEACRVMNDQGAAVTDLNQTISNPPTQAEVQAISDKVDLILAAMRGRVIGD